MIRSMTAYASCNITKNDFTASIEIRTYNSRFIDISLRIPHEYTDLEGKIKEIISNRLHRGRVEVILQAADASDKSRGFEIDTSKAKAYYEAIVQLKKNLNLKSEISIDQFTNSHDIIYPAQTDKDTEKKWPVILDCIIKALNNIDDMRKREGAYIADDLAKRLKYIEKCIYQIENKSSDLTSRYHEKLKKRISLLTCNMEEIDPWRLAQEAAILADKSDISEEIVRAKSHAQQFYTIMNSEKPAGKKLNFLLQEFNREFNTISSKAQNADVSHTIVDIKSELEKIREQVQNIE